MALRSASKKHDLKDETIDYYECGWQPQLCAPHHQFQRVLVGVHWQSDQVVPGNATGNFKALKVIVTTCHTQYTQATCEESWQEINSFQIRTICRRLDESNMYLLF